MIPFPVTDTDATDSVAVLALRISPKPFAGLLNIIEGREVVDAFEPDRPRPAEEVKASFRSVAVDSRLEMRGSLFIGLSSGDNIIVKE